MSKGRDVFYVFDEVIRKYPRFLREWYFSAREKRELKLKEFFSSIPPLSIVLEGACGKISRIRDFNADSHNIKTLIGLDLLKDSVKLNTALDYKTVGNLESLPFKKDYFDVVHLSNVLEHLNDPVKVFQEAFYVLKCGGFLLVSTKNLYSPLMFINHLLPLGFRYWIKKKILKSPAQHLDTFPAPYRCNSSIKLRKVLTGIGFTEVEMWLWGWPIMIVPSVGLFFSMIYEQLTDKKLLLFSKPNIYVKYKKI